MSVSKDCYLKGGISTIVNIFVKEGAFGEKHCIYVRCQHSHFFSSYNYNIWLL